MIVIVISLNCLFFGLIYFFNFGYVIMIILYSFHGAILILCYLVIYLLYLVVNYPTDNPFIVSIFT